ncbi:hypothetical protein J8657_19125, partial [Dickeya oryzae]
MNELTPSSTFNVAGLDDKRNTSLVAAHFIKDINGNPIVDPVPGGSQVNRVYLSDGTVLSGKDANPNNWLIGPASYSISDAESFAEQIRTLSGFSSENVASDVMTSSLLSAFGAMTSAFVQGGTQDLQRNPAWGIPSGFAVPAFVDVASYHLGVVTRVCPVT